VSPGGPPPPAPEPLPVPVVDSHCHLDLMAGPVEAALADARAVGVTRVVTVGVDVPTSELSARLAERYPEVYAAVAVHPNEASGADEAAFAAVERLAGRDRVRAVGETGLDYYRLGAPAAVQQAAFRRHIAIAKATGRALVIHDRDAHHDVLRILAEEGAPEHTVFHCYSGDAAMARECAERGYVLSFAGTLTFGNAPYLREAAAVVPLEQVLVETDAPFLAPAPHRGRPNGPYLIPVTVRALAAAVRRELAEVCAALNETSARVFGIAATG
jgi:TatD DNase family protein